MPAHKYNLPPSSTPAHQDKSQHLLLSHDAQLQSKAVLELSIKRNKVWLQVEEDSVNSTCINSWEQPQLF